MTSKCDGAPQKLDQLPHIQPASMKPNTPESIHSNIMDCRAALFSASTNRLAANVAPVDTIRALNDSASRRRRTAGTDRQRRLVALLDEAIHITSNISFPHESSTQASTFQSHSNRE
jgi:hypothetical protein